MQIEQMNWRGTLRILQYLHRDLQGSFPLGTLPLKERITQKCVVEQRRNQVSEVHSLILLHFSVGKLVSRPMYVPVQNFVVYQGRGYGRVSRLSYDVAVSQRAQIPECWMRRSRLFLKVNTKPYFKKRVNLEEQKAQMRDRFLRGRQVAYMIYEYFRVIGAHEAVLDFSWQRFSRF